MCQYPMFLSSLGLALSEKQVPQVDVNTEEARGLLEASASVDMRPRQARYAPTEACRGYKAPGNISRMTCGCGSLLRNWTLACSKDRFYLLEESATVRPDRRFRISCPRAWRVFDWASRIQVCGSGITAFLLRIPAVSRVTTSPMGKTSVNVMATLRTGLSYICLNCCA